MGYIYSHSPQFLGIVDKLLQLRLVHQLLVGKGAKGCYLANLCRSKFRLQLIYSLQQLFRAVLMTMIICMELNCIDAASHVKHGNNHLWGRAIALEELARHIVHLHNTWIENAIRRLNACGNLCNLLRLQLIVNGSGHCLNYSHNIRRTGCHALAGRQLGL